MLAEEREPRRLLVVTDVDVGFKRGLIAEDFIVVSLVWANGHVHGRVQVHPRDVTFKIIVGGEGLRPRGKKFLEAGIVSKSSRFAEQLCRPGEISAVFRAVGNELQLMMLIPPDHREET